MKYRIVVIGAFLATSLILFSNAYHLFWFERSQSGTGVRAGSSEYTRSTKYPLSDLSRYGDTVAVSVSSDRLTNILTTSLPNNSCVQAYSLSEDVQMRDPFVSLNSDQSLTPASTNKLATAAVVLTKLDPASTLDTSLLASKKSATIAKGYIRTSGDPSFVTTMTPPSRRPEYLSPKHVRTFDDFAKKIYDSGVRTITSLTIDDTWFDLDSIEKGWSDDKQEVGALAALNVNEGFSDTGLAESARSNAADALKAALERKGVTVGEIGFGAIPDSLTGDAVIATNSSVSVKDLVSDMLKTSDNVYAEQLLAAAAHVVHGTVTSQSRSELVTAALSDLGLDTTGYTFVNASGYSDDAKATCAFENSLLVAMKTRGTDLSAMSSKAGEDGTLAERFAGFTPALSAKTGTLDGVTALTGTIDSRIVFSFISNGGFSQDTGHGYQEQVASTLSNFPFVTSPVFSREKVSQ